MNPEAWSDAHPYKPCPDERCKHGSYESRDASGALVKIENCATCLGLGRVPMTIEEIRDEYRAVRDKAIGRGFTSAKQFDRMVAREADGSSLPGAWLAAARRVAAAMR